MAYALLLSVLFCGAIDRMGSRSFAQREKATNFLRAAGYLAWKALEARQDDPDPEIRGRVRILSAGRLDAQNVAQAKELCGAKPPWLCIGVSYYNGADNEWVVLAQGFDTEARVAAKSPRKDAPEYYLWREATRLWVLSALRCGCSPEWIAGEIKRMNLVEAAWVQANGR